MTNPSKDELKAALKAQLIEKQEAEKQARINRVTQANARRDQIDWTAWHNSSLDFKPRAK